MAQEKPLSQIISLLLAKPLSLRYEGDSEAFDLGRAWLIFMRDPCNVVAISLGSAHKRWPPFYFAKVLEGTEIVRESGLLSSNGIKPKLLEHFCNFYPACQHRYTVCKQDGERLDDIRYAEACIEKHPLSVENSRAPAVSESNLSKVLARRLELSIALTEVTPATLSVTAPEFGRSFDGTLSGSGRIFRVKVENGNAKICLRILEDLDMNKLETDTQAEAAVTLSLGTLGLTLEELMKLRPNMRVEFDKPEPFHAVLKFEGKDWAWGVLEHGADKVTFEVKEVLLDIAGNFQEKNTINR